MITFRKMHAADLDAVMQNETRAYAFPWTRGTFSDCMDKDQYSMHVVSEADEIIGHGVLSVAAGDAHLLNVCIARDYQGEGRGRALVRYLLELAAQRGAQMVFLEVRPSNVAALALYQSLGFVEVGTRRDYYPAHLGHEDAQVMALDLSVYDTAVQV